jgi:ribonuclease R
MKQLLRKLIAGVEPRFLNDRETELLTQIDVNFLKTEDQLTMFNSKFKPGVLKFTKSGKPIFLGLDESDPLTLHEDYLQDAKEDDIVIVQRIMGRSKKSAAKVVSIVIHDLTYSIGMIYSDENSKQLSLVDMYTLYEIKSDKDQKWINKHKEEDLVLIDNRHQTVIKELGNLSDPHVDEILSMAKYHKEELFSDAVKAEVSKIDLNVDASLYSDRKDLRHLAFCTIDPVTAKDYDDAIYYDTENKVLYVAIADVSHYVTPESALDQEAYKHGFSIYFPHKSVPMLPRQLSETLCSLQPHVDRLSYVFEMPINSEKIEIENAKVYEAIIHSQRRFTYEEIDAYIANDDTSKAKEPAVDRSILQWLFPLQHMMDNFRKKRMKNGYLFRSPDIEIALDSQTEMIKHTEYAEETPSHGLIEDCMLLANVQAALQFSTGLFRVHEAPSLAKLDNLYSQLSLMGLRFKLSPIIKETITSIQKEADAMDKRVEVDRLLIQTQMRAHYSPQNLGHFGLGFDAYAHFTSPIRRYSDLIVHRLIKAIQAKDKDEVAKTLQPINATAIDVSQKERESADVASDFAKRKFARWAKEHQGEEVLVQVDALLDGIKVESIAPIIGATMNLSDLPESVALFDNVWVRIDEANIRNCKIYATYIKSEEARS